MRIGRSQPCGLGTNVAATPHVLELRAGFQQAARHRAGHVGPIRERARGAAHRPTARPASSLSNACMTVDTRWLTAVREPNVDRHPSVASVTRLAPSNSRCSSSSSALERPTSTLALTCCAADTSYTSFACASLKPRTVPLGGRGVRIGQSRWLFRTVASQEPRCDASDRPLADQRRMHGRHRPEEAGLLARPFPERQIQFGAKMVAVALRVGP